jgi:hypothetical protein
MMSEITEGNNASHGSDSFPSAIQSLARLDSSGFASHFNSIAAALRERVLLFSFENTGLVTSQYFDSDANVVRIRCLLMVASNAQAFEPEYSTFDSLDALHAWFCHAWKHSGGDAPILATIRDEMARASVAGSEKLQDLLVTHVLEHLFAEPTQRAFFASWRSDPTTLGAMYHNASYLSGSRD